MGLQNIFTSVSGKPSARKPATKGRRGQETKEADKSRGTQNKFTLLGAMQGDKQSRVGKVGPRHKTAHQGRGKIWILHTKMAHVN